MKVRSFIAVEIPAEIQRAILLGTANLQKALPKPLVRWVHEQNLHLTLKFLGDISLEHLEELAGALIQEFDSYEPFTMPVGGLGSFPNSHHPRIIWVGLDTPGPLTTLQHGVDAVAARMGYAPEERPFSPHLTIGRVKPGTDPSDSLRIKEALKEASLVNAGIVRVDSVCIFKSDLRPAGPIYTPLYRLPIKSI